MAITTLDGLITAATQHTGIRKTQSVTTIAATPFSVFNLTGQPGAGTLAGTSTAAGVVPDDTVAGFPSINAFGGGATGYLRNIDFSCTVACLLHVFDCLFKAGAYSGSPATNTLASQPSYSGRVPGGTDFTNTEIWFECTTGFVGNLTLTVTYTNQAGVAGRSSGAVAMGFAPTVNRLFQLPLQAGDCGVQKIESVVVAASTSGNFNILVLRRLKDMRVNLVNGGDTLGPDRTGCPVIFATSALYLAVEADSTSTGLPSVMFDIVNG